MKNVLLLVSGTTPQIITETIWGLRARLHPINELDLHVVTTTRGKRLTQQELIDKGILQDLCTELSAARIPKLNFHLIGNSAGEALEDIRNTADNTALANTIANVVRNLTADPERRVHASLSGGRKTMSFYLGYAMSLYGRPQDMLYHVMVPVDFERCPDFFYIPAIPKFVTSFDGRQLSTADASIDIAEIPFLRLRDWIDEPILNAANVDFGAVTRKIQGALDRLTLTFDSDDCRVAIGDCTFGLPPQSFAMYRLFAEVCSADTPGAGPGGIGPGHRGWLTASDFKTAKSRGTIRFLEILDGLPKASAAKHDYITRVIEREGSATRASREKMGKIFNPILARLRAELAKKIADPAIRQQFGVHSNGRNPTRYGLLLQSQQISGL